MSHEYSRIPLTPGLNLICGPNGAGKSSILLGISVALGQSYTERSRRLGDLIMRGKNLGRVSLIFDNRPHNGKRPIPGINSDTVVLSRYLSKDGNYWHQINDRTVMKGEVLRLLRRLSIEPDNMLIIMHQNMINTFGAIDSCEKLKLVEEAVGISDYREKILEAQKNLSHTLSEEESIKVMLQRAHETLEHWKSEYERFKRKRGLESRKAKLELEYMWSKVIRQEENVTILRNKIADLQKEIEAVAKEAKDWNLKNTRLEEEVEKLENELDGQYHRVIERERAEAERRGRMETLTELTRVLEEANVSEYQNIRADARRLAREIESIKRELREESSRVVEIKQKLRKARNDLVEAHVKVAVLEFRKNLLERELSDGRRDLRRAKRELDKLEEEAKRIGNRVEARRKPQEVLEEIRIVNAQLASLTDISPDVERMYASYQATLRELEAKAREAEANRRRALKELELRKQRWRAEIEKLLNEVRREYQKFLKQVGGVGDVGLINAEDIESAGIELSVGFRGAKPQVLDAYTQSGGERTTALMCFLLALQRKIKSPIRAIDEFEAHLDPKNRERLFKSVADLASSDSSQYLVITPGQLVGRASPGAQRL